MGNLKKIRIEVKKAVTGHSAMQKRIDTYEWVAIKDKPPVIDGEYYVMEMRKAYLINGKFMDFMSPADEETLDITHYKIIQ